MKHQFKIGDRVRVIGHRPADWFENPIWISTMDGYAGKEGVADIIGVYVGVRFKDGKYCNYKPSWLIPIPAKEEALLKVGDRVRVLCSNSNRPAGTILSIDRVDSADMSLPYHAENWWYSKDQVELVAPNPLKSPPTFKSKCLSVRPYPKSTTKLPLINKAKLLTTIKLD